MNYIRNPEPKWLNEHLLVVDVKKIVKVVFWLLVLAVAYY